MSYKKQDVLTLREHMSSHPRCFGGVSVAHLFSFFVLSYYVPCCDVRYDFRIKTIFGSSLSSVVGERMSYLRYLCLFVHSGVQHILRCVFVVFFFVLCTLCRQFLWIVIF